MRPKPFVMPRVESPAARLQWLIPEVSKMQLVHDVMVQELGYDFRIRSREVKYAWPRQVAMWLMYRVAHRSYSQIAKFYGGLHHTSVLHNVRKIDRCRKHDLACFADTELFRSLVERAIENTQTSKPAASVSKSHPVTFGKSVS